MPSTSIHRIRWNAPEKDRYGSVFRTSKCGNYTIETMEYDLPIRCKGYLVTRGDGSVLGPRGGYDDLPLAKECAQDEYFAGWTCD